MESVDVAILNFVSILQVLSSSLFLNTCTNIFYTTHKNLFHKIHIDAFKGIYSPLGVSTLVAKVACKEFLDPGRELVCFDCRLHLSHQP